MSKWKPVPIVSKHKQLTNRKHHVGLFFETDFQLIATYFDRLHQVHGVQPNING